jgi:hypothetical protein
MNTEQKIVNIISLIRVDSRYAKSYINQISTLSENNYRIGKIILICDSILNPSEILEWSKLDNRVLLVQEKISDITLETIEEKTVQWAGLCNQGLETSLDFDSDFTLFIESDLCFPYDLIDELISNDVDIIAPVVFIGAGFYDSWGFRNLSGEKIQKVENISVTDPRVELSSVGSCVLFRTEVFSRGVRFRGPYQTGLLVGVCNDARDLGFKVWTSPSISIIHPTSSWRDQIWIMDKIHVDVIGVILTTNCIIASAFSDVILEATKGILSQVKEFSLQHGEYGFNFTKNVNNRTIEAYIFNVENLQSRFKFIL